ncbi:MAG: glycoside hydrolase family 15 protein [Chloroflexi bacterium]|nr:glycoside hydrolase family 15 protein [Chloroflexota bacterium]
MSYLPIEEYGLIGNMHTVALVGTNGAIDWFCPERFDAPSVFARILDAEQGGTFLIAPQTERATHKQFYWPDTNVLVTRFLCEDGVVEIVDYMPVGLPYEQMRDRWLIRRVKMVRGSLPMQLVCQPAFNYARERHQTTITANGAVFRSARGAGLALASPLPLTDENGMATAAFHLAEGETAVFSLHMLADTDECRPALSPAEERAYFEQTVGYWRRWLNQCTYTGRWREIVYRSALALKLLTYAPTGAIVAAPTTSLPEGIGGTRNWDYRYTWLRDAAFTVYGFIRIGFTEEAMAFAEWVEARMREMGTGDTLQIMYTIDGQRDIEEYTLDHLAGYCDSKPVRIGNAAHTQLQLDIYGELMDALYLYNKYAEPVDYDLWVKIVQMLDWVCENWQLKDKGIWEIRGEDRAFVYSKVMLWVALDRGIRLADKRSLPAPVDRWRTTRDTIYNEVLARGWNDQIEAFTQYYDGDTLDAANLIMPLVFFMSPRDPRMLKTLEAINRTPENGGLVSDSLVFRYNTDSGVDGIEGEEGTFNMCTFWLVEALTRAGRVEEARLIFEQMLSYANHVGLYAEETGFHGEALGNFPQAFTHLSLISAAFNLNRALEGHHRQP